MKTKICMVIPSFSAKGGITSVVSGYKGSKLEADYDIKYIETYTDYNKIAKALFTIKAYITFVITLIFWNPSIVHVHSSFGGSFYRKLPFIVTARWFNKPIVNHIHGSYYDEFYFNASESKKKRVTKTYNRCSAIVVLSEGAKEIVSKITETPIYVIPNYGVIQDNIINNNRDAYQVLFLGFITEKKGCFDIPYILSKVRKEIPNVHFILAGAGKIDELKSKIDEDCKKSIKFPGWVKNEDKDKLFRESNLFLLPSYSEGMPMSVLEAMGYGLPIVASNVGGVSTIVKDNVNGFVINPGNIEEFSQRIIEILINKDIKKKFSLASKEIIKNEYSKEKHISKIEKVYTLLEETK